VRETRKGVSVLEFCQWLQDTWLGVGIRESLWLFPILYTLHIFGVVILVAATSALDLRMLGVVMRKESVSDTAGLLLPWAKAGFVAQMVTGALIRRGLSPSISQKAQGKAWTGASKRRYPK